jgi:hypothetical protein
VFLTTLCTNCQEIVIQLVMLVKEVRAKLAESFPQTSRAIFPYIAGYAV